MRNLVFVLLASLFLFSCGNKEEATEIVAIDINNFADEAANYVDQEVSLTGTVTHICKHGGKKMHLIGDNDEKKIVVFAGEAIDEFPIDLEGEVLTITGKVIEEVYTAETIAEWEAQDAKNAQEAAEAEAVEEDAEEETVVEEVAEEVVESVEEVADVVEEEVHMDGEEHHEGEETHECTDETGDPYAELRQQIAESPDGKVRRYFLEVISYEKAEKAAE
jgi:hypothetical protein